MGRVPALGEVIAAFGEAARVRAKSSRVRVRRPNRHLLPESAARVIGRELFLFREPTVRVLSWAWSFQSFNLNNKKNLASGIILFLLFSTPAELPASSVGQDSNR